ncbi:MAG: hypothetical protein AAGF19_00895 [Pseudomonadota bacterium]
MSASIDYPLPDRHGARRPVVGDVLDLDLTITDDSLIDALSAYDEGPERDEFALAALKIGVQALAQAQTRIDVDPVREAGDRMVDAMGEALKSHREGVTKEIADHLTNYFDPSSGRFTERVNRLVAQDGELEQALRRQVGEKDSVLTKALEGHVGSHSPLMALLDPASATGLRAKLSDSMRETLDVQRQEILGQFSLDKPDSAISRFMRDLKLRHGEMHEALEKRLDKVSGEFSLDNPDGALSRLVGNMQKTEQKISREFSLDEEASALARMRKELLEVITAQNEADTEFRTQVLTELAGLTAKRKAADRSPEHGHLFEQALNEALQVRVGGSGDVLQATGNTTGQIKACKVGDAVLELGPDHAAAGARIVFEAKEKAGITLAQAREEIARGRANRQAGVGVFVFSARNAPDGVDRFSRIGDDLFAVWDADDPQTDVILDAALATAKALSVRRARDDEGASIDFGALDKSVREVERQVQKLDAIKKSSETIRSSADKILDEVRKMRDQLQKEVSALDDGLASLKKTPA